MADVYRQLLPQGQLVEVGDSDTPDPLD